MTSTTPRKTLLFLGATGGVGLSALRRALAADHTCIALCRTPSKLAALLPSPTPANLHLVEGNAHDEAALAKALVAPSDKNRLVDGIVFSIGAKPTLRGMDDPHVCEVGMKALLAALRKVKGDGVTGGKPLLVAVSSTGISDAGRDLPLLMVPLYKVLLGTAHKDKKAMENLAIKGGEEGLVDWTLIRGSLYTDGPATEGNVREGMEDVVNGVVESEAVGYTISREDVGKWVFENLVKGDGGKWFGKAATLTY
ncbi:oxidoreductase AflX [Staphylotrichum tortipilum]|uniref:Oxidoreductase AflX n=1 Tax=Staphylotrichum tortipilum TaxID=2831512 RepID=A0AAN6RPL7_9PEZI|nr:oxidoreductase AflX [Staphylotrichum longicolle]